MHADQSLNSTAEQENELHRTMKARGASWPAQVYYCWKRAMTQQVRNSTSFFFEIGVGGLAGLIIGLSAFAAKGHLFQGLYHPPFTMLSSATDYQGTPQLGLLGGYVNVMISRFAFKLRTGLSAVERAVRKSKLDREPI